MSTDASQASHDAVRTVARQLREYALETLAEADHGDLSRAAGLFNDPKARKHMVFAEQAWEKRRDPDDPHFWETTYAVERVEQAASEVATEAIEDGNLSQMQYILGWVEYESDISGRKTMQQLEDWLCHSERCKLIYLAGLMGRGKTDWSLSMLDQIHWHYKRIREVVGKFGGDPSDVPTPEFAANFEVDPAPEGVECKQIDNYDDLVKWGEQGSSDDVRWFVFDEASTELTAQSASNAQDVAEFFAPFVKKMRKMGINMIVVGHDKGDVHVAIRSMADFVSKPGLKSAAVYAAIKNREPAGHLFDLDKIPQTAWGYETDDMAEWSWGSASEDAEIEGYDQTAAKRLVAKRGARLVEEHDLSQKKAARVLSDDEISISRQMIRDASNGKYGPVSA